jgi:putative ABC transport system permease protein
MIDHASADLWIIPNGTKCFEDPPLIGEQQRFRAISIGEVTEAVPVVIGYAQWRLPSGATTPVFIVGSRRGTVELQPWNLVGGDLDELSHP